MDWAAKSNQLVTCAAVSGKDDIFLYRDIIMYDTCRIVTHMCGPSTMENGSHPL